MPSAHPNEIPLGGWSELTSDYSELARFWVSSEWSFVLVANDLATTPALLGSLLVECVHTAAKTYGSDGSLSRAEALSELWRGFDEERTRLSEEEI